MRRGFSQIEVLAAVGVLAVGLLSVVAAFIYHFRVTNETFLNMQASALGSRLMSAVRAQVDLGKPIPVGFKDSPVERRALNDEPLQKERFSPEELRAFRRNIRVQPLSTDTNSYKSRLFLNRVQLNWDEKGSPRELVYQACARK